MPTEIRKKIDLRNSCSQWLIYRCVGLIDFVDVDVNIDVMRSCVFASVIRMGSFFIYNLQKLVD